MARVKYIFVYIFLFVLCFATVQAQDKSKLLTLENEVMYSQILGQEVKYSVCLPEDYHDSNKAYPVVYMLHGLGDNASSWLEYGRIDLWTKERVSQGNIIPMIYIMPEGYRNYYVNDFYGKFRYQDMFIQELIPHVDKKYRTVADKNHRATVGYSMGGFGALTLAVQYQDVFSVTVPLSISIRTDQQYMKEDSKGWDDQWGRLFGGVGLEGEQRLTDYYKKNCPFYIFRNKPIDSKIFILNGDDEGSLAYSNEELHILMRDLNIPHEYRVRNGGHDFEFWFEALSDGMNFVSDAFEGKTYRGDQVSEIQISASADLLSGDFEGVPLNIYLPKGYDQGNRLYPVLYVDAAIDESIKNNITKLVAQKIESMEITPMLVVFFDSQKLKGSVDSLIQYCESEYRIRGGRRFSAYVGYQGGAVEALRHADKEKFTYVAAFDASMLKGDQLLSDLSKKTKKDFQRTAIYIDTPDRGEFYEANGRLHLLLKDMEVKHEYRVSESVELNDYLLRRMDAVLKSISDKIHI